MTESNAEESHGEPADPKTPQPVTALTIARFLIGREDAIRSLAACPGLWKLGFLLVLSAGFAREYDGEDLLHEPWQVLIPHAASLFTSMLLYVLCVFPAVRSLEKLRAAIADYPRFLGLFWMTAPLAWLYAIPFEHLLSEGNATRWNLYLLGIVSVWRVVLMIRVINIVLAVKHVWHSAVTVLFFGNAVMLAAIYFVPAPILQLMGGIRLTEAEEVMMATKLLLQLIGYPTLLLLAIAYLFALAPTTSKLWWIKPGENPIGSRTWLAAWLTVLMWLPVLPVTQPPQILRREAEQRLADGDVKGALLFLSEHERDEFPPQWQPRPHIALPNETLEIVDVMDVFVANRSELAPWVEEVYLEKFATQLDYFFHWRYLHEEADLRPYLDVLIAIDVEDWIGRSENLVGGALSDLRTEAEYSEETMELLDEVMEKIRELNP